MSILDLIHEHCPNGIEFVPLGEYFTRLKGTPITANKMKKIAKDSGDLKIFAGGKTTVNSNREDIEDLNEYNEPLVIFQCRGIIDVIYYDRPCTFKNEFWAYKHDNPTTTKFLYFYLQTQLNYYRQEASYKGTIPQLSLSFMNEQQIPLPPLKIQQKIVDILDKMELLTKELNLRKKQYNYYRNHLLRYNPNPIHNGLKPYELGDELSGCNGTYTVPLEQAFTIRGGYTPSKRNLDYWENGTIPWYRMEDIRTNGRMLSDSIQKITPLAVKGKGLFPAGSIILSTTATIGEHAMLIADSLANQRFTNFTISESHANKIDPKFAYHYFYIIGEWCKDNVMVGTFAAVEMKKLRQYPFPIPPLDIQKQIADVLDKFEQYTNEITGLLPKEIELRKKQYKYYRDLLLDF